MKKLLLIVFIIGSSGVMAQEQVKSAVPADSIPFEVRKQAYIYNLATKYNDPAVARMALYNLVASSQNSLHLMDTLALMYLEYEQYASAALVSQDVYQINPNDLFAAEIAAVSFEQLGVYNKAVDYYEKLYLESNDLGTLYKMAFLQLNLKRYGESIANADIIIGSEESDNLKLIFPTQENNNQQVSLKAASLRLKGMVEASRGNKELAKEHYQKALELEPEFQVLKQQISELDKGN